MLHQATTALAPPAAPGAAGDPADRRAHRRLASVQLPGARIRIPYRPAVSLLDLSSGGALFELPFQAQPQSRFSVELHTSVERLVVPFRLLRCYVVRLRGGVLYHAAGAFDHLLDLPPSMAGQSPSYAVERLIGTLERLLRAGQEADPLSRHSGQFHELLARALAGLRRGESVALVALKFKSQLTQRYPSLAITPSTPFYRGSLMSAEFFGFTFTSRSVLSSHDRRFLRSIAQVMSMMESCRRQTQVETETETPPEEDPSPLVTYTTAEWLAARSPNPRPAIPKVRQASHPPSGRRSAEWTTNRSPTGDTRAPASEWARIPMLQPAF